MMFCQFMSGTFGNVAARTQAACPRQGTLGGCRVVSGRRSGGSFRALWGRNRSGADRFWGEYYVISLESEDTNMSIRGKSIFATLAIMLIATAPAWSQSLLKRLDPDKDGTVDLAEAKSAAV